MLGALFGALGGGTVRPPAPPRYLYRTGTFTDNALTAKTAWRGVQGLGLQLGPPQQVFDRGNKIFAVDTAKLPKGTVVPDSRPDGHVSVYASPDEIRDAVVKDGGPLEELGLKPVKDGAFRIPKK